MAERLRQIVYSSASTHPLAPEELAEILRTSRRNNDGTGITGMLVYRRGHFLQILEGPDDKLSLLLLKLGKDPRHDHLHVLLDGPILARAFGTWSMAFQDVSGIEPGDLPVYSRFLTDGFTNAECVRYPQKALRMVLAFRDMNLGVLT